MAKCILFAGQSLPERMFTVSSGTCTPHADTHMWNGSGWSPPAGDGAITYANCLRGALQEHIYLVNACVGGSALLPYGSNDHWSCSTGALVCDAISQTQAALGSVSGLCLDRVEWWQGQTEAYTSGGPSDMCAAYSGGLQTLLSTLRTALGNGFRFCIWPLGRVHVGSTAAIVRAQMAMVNASTAAQNGIEPGPASYDRAYASDNVHLGSAAEYLWMGIRGARNAMSYFVAKANAADTIPHYGAGPVVESLLRDTGGQSQTMFARPRVKNGLGILPGSVWPRNATLWTTGWRCCWGSGGHDWVPVEGAQITGGWIKLYTTWAFSYPMWVSYQAEAAAAAYYYDGPSNSIYDTNQQWGDQGQPMLPLALGAMTSN